MTMVIIFPPLPIPRGRERETPAQAKERRKLATDVLKEFTTTGRLQLSTIGRLIRVLFTNLDPSEEQKEMVQLVRSRGSTRTFIVGGNPHGFLVTSTPIGLPADFFRFGTKSGLDLFLGAHFGLREFFRELHGEDPIGARERRFRALTRRPLPFEEEEIRRRRRQAGQ